MSAQDTPIDTLRHYRCLEDMYHSAPINTAIPSQLSVSADEAFVQMEVAKDFWHSANALHGSMYFKGLDDAAFFAAQSIVFDFFVLTAQFQVTLLAKVTSLKLTAKGQIKRRDGRKIWASSSLFDEQETRVARGEGLFVISDMPLSPDLGYPRS